MHAQLSSLHPGYLAIFEACAVFPSVLVVPCGKPPVESTSLNNKHVLRSEIQHREVNIGYGRC